MAGLGVSSASILALPAFWASASGASDFLSTIFSETFQDVSFTKALEKWLSLKNEQESPLDGTQKNWTQPVYVKPAQDFNAHQGKFGSQWLNVVLCKNLGLKLGMISNFGFQFVNVSEPTFVLRIRATVVKVERDGLHGLSCTKSAGRLSCHVTLNSLIKQTLESLDLLSMLEPRGLY